MRKEFMDLYVSYRNNGLSRDEAYNAAYKELKERYNEDMVHTELEIR